MRGRLLIGIAGLVIAAASPARGADMAVTPAPAYGYPAIGVRAAPNFFYDFEPGIAVRAYWLPPWRNRHYFPRGRDRIKAAAHRGTVPRRPGQRARPAQSFHREWSTPADICRCAADAQYSALARDAATAPNAHAGEVINADADVTILGPDRMNIRLFRKRGDAQRE